VFLKHDNNNGRAKKKKKKKQLGVEEGGVGEGSLLHKF
jgi:hypothetical protein